MLFLQQASEEYTLDLSQSYLIGDHPDDFCCAENAGATGVYLFTGHGMKLLNESAKKQTIQSDILQVESSIKSQIRSNNQ